MYLENDVTLYRYLSEKWKTLYDASTYIQRTDLLTVSCSTTDYIGHQVGTHTIETEDTYLRLDKAIADFLSYLDAKVGKGNYLVFLSADHGAMNNARFLQDR